MVTIIHADEAISASCQVGAFRVNARNLNPLGFVPPLILCTVNYSDGNPGCPQGSLLTQSG